MNDFVGFDALCAHAQFHRCTVDLGVHGLQVRQPSPLFAGEEAAAVGAISVITENDVIASTHRGHRHCGAIGDKHAKTEMECQEHWNKMMAELMGNSTGCCKGKAKAGRYTDNGGYPIIAVSAKSDCL